VGAKCARRRAEISMLWYMRISFEGYPNPVKDWVVTQS